MASRVDAAITAIVAALQADAVVPTLAAVVDGPLVGGDQTETRVYVGYDGDPDGDFNATENWSQDWAGLGAQRKDESFDVVCAVWSFSGDLDVPARRQKALAVFSAVEDALRTPLNIGLGLPQPTVAWLSSAQLVQEPVRAVDSDQLIGLRARIPFSISVRTRI